jgi:hypothetical protein
MTTAFMVCAAFGGTIMVLQAIMAIAGLGGEALHTDLPHDIGHDFGGDVHADLGSDFHGGVGEGLHGGADGTPHDAIHDEQHGSSQHDASSRLFAMLSLRGIVAAMAFFGLGGLTAESAELPVQTVLVVAVACGGAAMYGMYAIMQWFTTLHAEGTARIERAVGHPATVYLRIPGSRAGAGKIQINLQNRTMEYLAVTADEPLDAEARVVVVGVANSETVEVRPLSHEEGDGNE